MTIRPEPCRAHVRQNELGELCEAEEVHFELVTGVVERDVLDGPVEAEAGVVDEDVDPPLGLDDPAHGLLVVRAHRDVHLDGDDPVVGHLGQAVHPPGAGVHRVALLRHQDRRLTTHARRRSGDQYNLAHCVAPSGSGLGSWVVP